MQGHCIPGPQGSSMSRKAKQCDVRPLQLPCFLCLHKTRFITTQATSPAYIASHDLTPIHGCHISCKHALWPSPQLIVRFEQSVTTSNDWWNGVCGWQGPWVPTNRTKRTATKRLAHVNRPRVPAGLFLHWAPRSRQSKGQRSPTRSCFVSLLVMAWSETKTTSSPKQRQPFLFSSSPPRSRQPQVQRKTNPSYVVAILAMAQCSPPRSRQLSEAPQSHAHLQRSPSS